MFSNCMLHLHLSPPLFYSVFLDIVFVHDAVHVPAGMAYEIGFFNAKLSPQSICYYFLHGNSDIQFLQGDLALPCTLRETKGLDKVLPPLTSPFLCP